MEYERIIRLDLETANKIVQHVAPGNQRSSLSSNPSQDLCITNLPSWLIGLFVPVYEGENNSGFTFYGPKDLENPMKLMDCGERDSSLSPPTYFYIINSQLLTETDNQKIEMVPLPSTSIHSSVRYGQFIKEKVLKVLCKALCFHEIMDGTDTLYDVTTMVELITKILKKLIEIFDNTKESLAAIDLDSIFKRMAINLVNTLREAEVDNDGVRCAISTLHNSHNIMQVNAISALHNRHTEAGNGWIYLYRVIRTTHIALIFHDNNLVTVMNDIMKLGNLTITPESIPVAVIKEKTSKKSASLIQEKTRKKFRLKDISNVNLMFMPCATLSDYKRNRENIKKLETVLSSQKILDGLRK